MPIQLTCYLPPWTTVKGIHLSVTHFQGIHLKLGITELSNLSVTELYEYNLRSYYKFKPIIVNLHCPLVWRHSVGELIVTWQFQDGRARWHTSMQWSHPVYGKRNKNREDEETGVSFGSLYIRVIYEICWVKFMAEIVLAPHHKNVFFCHISFYPVSMVWLPFSEQ